MKRTLFAAVLMFSAFYALGQSDNPKYDQALTESLGGDDYGMKKNERNYRGIFILNADTLEEGRLLVDSDPAVQSKLLVAEISMLWFSRTATVPKVSRISREKENVG